MCLDRSAVAEAALDHAIRLTRREGSRITLLSALAGTPHDTMAGLPPDPLEWHLSRTSAQTYLDGIRDRIHTHPVEVAREVVQGDPAEQVVAFAARTSTDLVVLATHGMGRRAGYCLGSTAMRLIEGLPTSLLVVPVGSPEATPAEGKSPEVGPTEGRYRRILLPLDGSVRAESALPVVASLARDHDAEVLLSHVVCTPDTMPAEPPEPEDIDLQRRLRRRNEARALRYLSRLQVRLVDGGARARILVVRGTCPRSELSGLIAREEVDLVVVSSHGRTGRLEQPLGSVTNHLIRTHPVPVLVVREPGALSVWRRRMAAEAETPPAPVSPEGR